VPAPAHTFWLKLAILVAELMENLLMKNIKNLFELIRSAKNDFFRMVLGKTCLFSSTQREMLCETAPCHHRY
jgi:hypothetical protein